MWDTVASRQRVIYNYRKGDYDGEWISPDFTSRKSAKEWYKAHKELDINNDLILCLRPKNGKEYK